MRNRFRIHWLFIFFTLVLWGQNDEKLASPLVFFKEKQFSKIANYYTPALYSELESTRINKSTGLSEKGYNCIVYTQHPESLRAIGLPLDVSLPSFSTAWLTLEQIGIAASLPQVTYIDVSTSFKPNNDISVAGTGASLLHNGRLNNTSYKGDGVIIAIVDSGIDWDHLDFRDPANPLKSRILRIWDQTLIPEGAERSPVGYSLGVEYTKEQIEDEIDGTPAGFVREKDTDGHGTHVAGTAVGNGAAFNSKYSGLAPNADIVVVKAGNGTFSTTNLISSLDYLKNLANTLGKPIVVNMSLGSQDGAHDGTDPLEVAIDNFTDSAAGHIVVVASGNDNGDNIHNQIVLAPTLETTIQVQVPTASASTKRDVFQHTMYANDAGTVTVVVTAPDGTQATSLAASGTVIMDGNARVYISNSIDPGSGDRKVEVYLTRVSTTFDVSGTWSIALKNTSLNTLTIDGWLDYKGDDYASTALIGGDSNYLVTIPGNATKAITVGSFMGRLDWTSSSGSGYSYNNGIQDDISTFSGIGPRRDNVIKPDITANGQAVISCLSSDSNLSNTSPSMVVNGLYKVEQGTSMATPAVAGCIALLLQMKPNATFDQIKTAITTTASKDSFTSNLINSTWGNGRIDVFRAASSFTECQPLSRVIYNYEQPYTSLENFSFDFSGQKVALKFTTTINGNLGGFFLKTVRNQTLTTLNVEVRSNNSGVPGNILGSKAVTPTMIAKNTWNYVDLTSLAIPISKDSDYFLVIEPGINDSFGLGQERPNNSRSYLSNNGTTWTSIPNLRIRPEVYAIQGQGQGLTPGNLTVELTSSAGTNSQSRCKGIPITPITYKTFGSSDVTFTGLPAGITGVWLNNQATITGSSTQVGTYNYSIKLVSSCNTITATGKIIISGTPTISEVKVVKEQSETAVTVNGNNFEVASFPSVTIGGLSATVRSASFNTIVFLLPQNSTGGNIIITNSCNESSNPFPYPFVAPTNINLSSNTINSNNLVGSTVATILGTDSDQNDILTYSLVNGLGSEDNSNFSILNNSLKAAIVFNAQLKSSHKIRIRATDSGGLFYEKEFVITISADQDSDGIPDNLDQCPNTTVGVKVDFKGCEIFLLPADNFTALVTATSCVGQKNGSISVSAKNTTFIYNVTINGQAGFQLNTANSFTNQFQNLAPGNYEICISVQGKPNFLQCYNLVVREPNILALTNKMSPSGKQVTYNLSGSTNYNVTFNGQTIKYYSNEITLNLSPGQNSIAIATDIECQGKFEQTIFLGDQIVFYPNPVKDYVTIFCPGTDDEVIISTVTILGVVKDVFKIKLDSSRGFKLDLTNYASGMYIVQVKSDNIEEIIKVIKQ